MIVFLPVLSEAMTVAEPKVSTDLNCLMKTCLSAIVLAAIAKQEVMVTGKPSEEKIKR